MRRLVALFCTLTLLSGCIPSVPLNNRAVVRAVGIDLLASGGYRVTMQVNEAVDAATQPEGSNRALVVEESGSGMTDLLARAAVSQGKQIFLGSIRLIVLGEAVAREGAKPVLDFFNASHQVAPTTAVVVARGEAGALLRAGEKDPKFYAESLLDLLKSAQEAGYAPRSRLMDFLGAAEGENQSPLLAVLSTEKTGAAGQSSVQVSGAGVFRRDRLEVLLNARQTRGLQWLGRQIKATSLSVADGTLGQVSALTHRQKAVIKVDLVGDNPVFDVRVEVESTALEAPDQPMSGWREYAQALQASQIEQEILDALKRTQAAGYDLLGLSLLMKQRQPDYYLRSRDNWEAVLAASGYHVTVDCRIDRKGAAT